MCMPDSRATRESQSAEGSGYFRKGERSIKLILREEDIECSVGRNLKIISEHIFHYNEVIFKVKYLYGMSNSS